MVDPATAAPLIYIHGMGHFHPDNVIDNGFLEELDIGTSNDWIMDRVGIRSRRTVLDLDYIRETRNQDVRAAAEASMYSNRETGKFAAEKALKAANVGADQIGMVIAGGCSPDTVTPAEACSIAAALGIDATAFDLNSACSSFAVQMHFLSQMRPEALPEFVLLISPENNTRTIDYNDRSTAVLWGDGTSAAVVSTRVPSAVSACFSSMTSQPAGWDKVVIPRMGHFEQEGLTVQTFAIKRSTRCFRALQEQTQRKDLHFIGHQANKRMLESVCARCDISDQHHYFNVDQYGNTGAAGAPIVLSQRWNDFSAGDQLAMVVVGSGLTWSGLAISFGARDD